MGIRSDRNNELIKYNTISMNKNKALEIIKEAWENSKLSFEEKIISIANVFNKANLDIATTASYIEMTPAELDAFISLSKLDKGIIKEISKVNPPKTTWTFLASGNEYEIKRALVALSELAASKKKNETLSELTIRKMREDAKNTSETISQLSKKELRYLAKKAKLFFLEKWDINFLNSIAKWDTLSDNQIATLRDILNRMADNNAIQRNSIDGDKELCDKVLDALGR